METATHLQHVRSLLSAITGLVAVGVGVSSILDENRGENPFGYGKRSFRRKLDNRRTVANVVAVVLGAHADFNTIVAHKTVGEYTQCRLAV